MYPLSTLTLFFSWRCNLACLHCGFNCGPAREGSMPVDQALAYIEQVSDLPSLHMIAYSGGEPFLYYDRLLQCMTSAHQHGLAGGVVTNCWWADDAQTAQQRLDAMAYLGLEEIIVSLDDFHLRHVPLERIRHVVNAALGDGVRVGVNMLVVQNSKVRKSSVLELLKLPTETIQDPARIWLRESSPLLVGRARSHLRRDQLYYYGESLLRGSPCYFVVRNMVVTPDQKVYACCGFGDASEEGPASIAYVGDLGQSPFVDLLEQAAGNLLLNILATCGPWMLLDMVQKAYPTVVFRREYVSNCDICNEISTNLPLRRAVARVLHQAAESVTTLKEG